MLAEKCDVFLIDLDGVIYHHTQRKNEIPLRNPILLELSQEIVNKIPNSEFEIINNAGHHLHIEQPETLSKIMIEFLSMI